MTRRHGRMEQLNFGGGLPDIGLMRETVDPAVLALHNL